MAGQEGAILAAAVKLPSVRNPRLKHRGPVCAVGAGCRAGAGGSEALAGDPAGAHSEHCCSQTPAFSLLLKKAQQAPGNERMAFNLRECMERDNDLLASGLDHWVGAGTLRVLTRW